MTAWTWDANGAELSMTDAESQVTSCAYDAADRRTRTTWPDHVRGENPGGGFRGGMMYGQTDEFSHHAVENVVQHTDWLTTVLHQFGLQQDQLKFRRGLQDLTLLDGVSGRVVRELPV